MTKSIRKKSGNAGQARRLVARHRRQVAQVVAAAAAAHLRMKNIENPERSLKKITK